MVHSGVDFWRAPQVTQVSEPDTALSAPTFTMQ